LKPTRALWVLSRYRDLFCLLSINIVSSYTERSATAQIVAGRPALEVKVDADAYLRTIGFCYDNRQMPDWACNLPFVDID